MREHITKLKQKSSSPLTIPEQDGDVHFSGIVVTVGLLKVSAIPCGTLIAGMQATRSATDKAKLYHIQKAIYFKDFCFNTYTTIAILNR
jgi:hypothetical protein